MDAFYQSILASVLFYAVLSQGWGGSISAEDKNRINKMIKKAGSVIGLIPATLEATVEMRARSKLKLILGYKTIHCTMFLRVLEAHSGSDWRCLSAPLNNSESSSFFVPF